MPGNSIKQLFFSENNYTGNDVDINYVTVENVVGTIPNYNDILYSSNIVTYDIEDKIFKVQGKITANQIRNNSDIKLKKDVQEIKNSLQTINKLNGKRYRLKSSNEVQYGFIAQEMETVLPDIVDQEDGILNISYIELIPLMVESIKQLDKKIEKEGILKWVFGFGLGVGFHFLMRNFE